MQRFVLLIFFTVTLGAHSQNYPLISPATIQPVVPTTNDDVLVICSFEIPGQGHRISKQVSVLQNIFTVELEVCYHLDAAQSFRKHQDTFYVGKLDDGVYAVNFSARLSESTNYCNGADSNFSAVTLTVEVGTGLYTGAKKELRVYPNPVKDLLIIEGVEEAQQYQVFNSAGRLMITGEVNDGGLNTGSLPAGIYLLSFNHSGYRTCSKFVKIE